jgi:serine/threonine protein kinase/WD40 repeat protein
MKRFDIEPADHEERLGEAVEAYLALAESGHPPEPETFASSYPDLGDELVEALEGLSLLRGLVGKSGEHGRLEVGRRLAGYRIVRELGYGGMGVVYEAVHVDLDRPVALKVLDARATPDSGAVRRFQEEAKTAAGLHHTHIVPVFDVGHVGGLCYYAMQRIEGSGLDRVVRALRRDRSTAAGSASSRTGPRAGGAPAVTGGDAGGLTASWSTTSQSLPARQRHDRDEAPAFVPPRGNAYFRWVAEAGRQAAQALAHAHRRGVIHRDIKPSNLLVDARGTIWVTDFGLARRLADPSLTRTDSLLGTPKYMSPEQAKGTPIDARSDVFSLGATLYELLTLCPPFDGRSAAELAQQIGERDPAAPRSVDARIPRDLETIVLKALAKRAGDRYGDATELAEDLSRYLHMEPVKARRIGPVGRAWRLARRHPALTAVSLSAAATIVAVATVAYVRVIEERNLARRAAATTQNALAEAKAANRATQKAMRQQLLASAALARISPVPDRRDQGLALIRRAAGLAPDAAMRSLLRAEAVELLSLRDIEAQPEVAIGPSRGLAFGPTGGRLAVLAEDDSTVAFWDTATHARLGRPVEAGPRPDRAGQRRTRPPGGFFWLPPPRLAAAGPLTAVLWPDGHGLRLLDTATGAVALDLKMTNRELRALYASTSSAGLRLVTVEALRVGGGEPPSRDRPPRSGIRTMLWDPSRPDEALATLQERPPEEGRPPIPLVALAPDGETLATAWAGDTPPVVTLWSARDGSKLDEIDSGAPLTALAVGPDKLLAAAGGGAVRLWQLESKSALAVIAPQQALVVHLGFSSDGTLLAVAGRGTGIELWDPAANQLVAALPTPHPVTDLAFSPVRRTLVAAQPASAIAWQVSDPVVRVRLAGLQSPPTSLAFGPEGVLGMASVLGDGPARFWDPERCPSTVHAVEHLAAAALTADERDWLAAVGGELLRLEGPKRQVKDRIELRGARPPALPGRRNRGEPPAARVQALARTPDDRVVAAVRFNEVLLWRADGAGGLRPVAVDMSAGRTAPRGPRGGPFPVYWKQVALSPSGDRLFLLAGWDGELQCWSLSDDHVQRAWTAPVQADAMALSPDGTTVALGERSGTVRLLDAYDGTMRSRLEPVDEHEGPAQALAFAPSGRVLAVGTKAGLVRLWQLGGRRPEPLVRLPGHRGAVLALTYDRAGRRLASGGEDKTVDVWDLDHLRRELDGLGLGW